MCAKILCVNKALEYKKYYPIFKPQEANFKDKTSIIKPDYNEELGPSKFVCYNGISF